ncbi:unnamed protein product [Rhizophagus irregularis]|uniref:PiggyBac transposable element-derived protein domain-containing protein n=1 Tax=Rhizophagus irregularis TaxID=588596 RepID=A0A2I1H762_9GLOM|nr:hypothetical protein RhiirA4_473678 [Rhizophagus irregularis]CAB4413540.1 unnamed protein product [Rhizophagus irregularis]CAB4413958.1 unnamed protein product [Rhizophagus irregularis]
MPRINNTNSSTVKRVFGDNSKKELPIPEIIDDYNHFMGGVNIADQYRSSYIIQFPVIRVIMTVKHFHVYYNRNDKLASISSIAIKD